VIDRGKQALQVAEERGPDQSISRLGTGRTAFVGRTLRGPVNRPVLIKSFAEFQHVFGGLWQPSLLGYAIEQFFDNGGREALIVRVVNGARSATLSLKAGEQGLQLQALRPGTREFLRASVDFDNIAADETAVFNLTVQRVRAQGTGQVNDQEIFHRLSVIRTDERYFPNAIAQSALIRLIGAMPTQRPDRTLDPASGLATAYVNSNSDGDDGAPLTDYDLIGSSLDHTGVFALHQTEYFNFLCIPPLSRDRDVGPSVLLVAARYCKERRALLIVDPPSSWQTADDALSGLRDWNFSNENALMYFPRILAHDKLRGHFESFAPCGAVAGMLARYDEGASVWLTDREEPILRPGFRPVCMVGEDRRMRLARLGVNTLQAVRSAGRMNLRLRTLAAGNAASADWRYLSARRLALFILGSIELGTRWVVAAGSSPEVADTLTAQVRAFFEGLHAAGSFGTRRMEEAFFVVCDERVNNPASSCAEVQFVIGFAASREHEFHCFRILQSAAGSKVQPVSLNRLNFSQYSPAELEWVDSIASQLHS
jgi:uncharacterized protein